MHTLFTLVLAIISLWAARVPSECETPPFAVASPSAPPWWYPTWPDEHYAGFVVDSQGVASPELALGGQDDEMAQLTSGGVITFAWSLPLKSSVTLWLYADLVNCPYSKVTTKHYIDLASTPIYTSDIWVSMGNGYVLISEFEPYEPPDLPFHRYVVVSSSEPLQMDAVALLLPYYPIRRWMPIMMAQ